VQKQLAVLKSFPLLTRIYDFGLLIKFKLLLFVVFSASFAYLLGIKEAIDWNRFFWLSLGGVLVTGAANGLNEIFEKDYDALMSRTSNRPLPAGRMHVNEATVLSIMMGLAGMFVLAHYLNLLCGILGMIAMFLYAFAYTPMKRVTPFSVFVGAIPGAMPPLIGWVAATGTLSVEAFMLFSIQFLWQFPHFWAIAWRMDDDYSKAGFRMLPSKGGKNKATAFQTVIYSASLIPAGLMPFWMNLTGMVSASLVTAMGLIFTWYAYQLYLTCSDKAARNLMIASIVYLPVVMISLVLDKV
jgi:protoheme IX farnesyltransferase